MLECRFCLGRQRVGQGFRSPGYEVSEANVNMDGGSVRVIRGSGKRKNATGTGMLKRTSESSAIGTYDDEFNITTTQ